jgi:hypothetical protein
MRKIEPTGLHQCPEGYEYVNGHEEKGIHVRPYCRKISKKRIKMKFDMRYPGNTTITASVREGFKRESASYNVPTDSLFVDEKGKQLQDIMNEQWMGKEGTLKKKEK